MDYSIYFYVAWWTIGFCSYMFYEKLTSGRVSRISALTGTIVAVVGPFMLVWVAIVGIVYLLNRIHENDFWNKDLF